MSVLAIILIVLGAIALLFFIGGVAYTMRRWRRLGRDFYRHVRQADAALEQARAADKGWDRDALEAAARSGLSSERPDFEAEELYLVLVDDRPGVTEDRAEFVAMGPAGTARIALVRDEAGWRHDRVE